MVDELITRKRAEGLAFPDRNFPQDATRCLFKCWDSEEYETEDAATEEMALETKTNAKREQTQKMLAAGVFTASSELTALPKRKPQKNTNPGTPGSLPGTPGNESSKDTAKSLRQQATRQLKELSMLEVECTTWSRRLREAGVPEAMVAAMEVAATGWSETFGALRAKLQDTLITTVNGGDLLHLENVLEEAKKEKERFTKESATTKKLLQGPKAPKGTAKEKVRAVQN